jgi:hypothetical protein
MKTLRQMESESGVSKRKLYRFAKRIFPARFSMGLRTVLEDREAELVIAEIRKYDNEPSSANKVLKRRVF